MTPARLNTTGYHRELARAVLVTGCDPDAILRPGYNRRLLRARRLLCRFLRERGLSYPEIGELLGLNSGTVWGMLEPVSLQQRVNAD